MRLAPDMVVGGDAGEDIGGHAEAGGVADQHALAERLHRRRHLDAVAASAIALSVRWSDSKTER
jgi:hypothetical protein